MNFYGVFYWILGVNSAIDGDWRWCEKARGRLKTREGMVRCWFGVMFFAKDWGWGEQRHEVR